MFKKLALLATFAVATVCGWAPQAKAQWIAAFAVKRWHDHYAHQGHGTHNIGWDYASGIGHGSWGAHPLDWGIAIAHSAAPWPPAVDHAIPGYPEHMHLVGWHKHGPHGGAYTITHAVHGGHVGWHATGHVGFEYGYGDVGYDYGAHAWHGSHGSWGSHGSHGCWGSHGSHGSHGSWGSHGSHGSHGSWGSHGSHGSHGCWGSHGSHGSHGSWGSHGSHGSHGSWGSYGSAGGYDADPSYGFYGDGAAPLSDGVYDDVDGGPGAFPPAGPSLEYEPRTGPRKEGELVEPPMAPKKTAVPTTTMLVLNVPADAQVTLAGVDTKSSGATREFATTLLSDSNWSDYTVRVELNLNGKKLVEERTITLYPGDNRQMTIDFPTQVASK